MNFCGELLLPKYGKTCSRLRCDGAGTGRTRATETAYFPVAQVLPVPALFKRIESTDPSASLRTSLGICRAHSPFSLVRRDRLRIPPIDFVRGETKTAALKTKPPYEQSADEGICRVPHKGADGMSAAYRPPALRRLFPLTSFLALLFVVASTASATRVSLSPRFGVANLHGNDSTTFFLQSAWGFDAAFSLAGKLDAVVGYGHYKLNDDSSGSSFSFSGDKDNHLNTWKSDRFSLGVRRWFFSYDNPFNIALGLTGGVQKWNMHEAVGDTVRQVDGEKNTIVRFTASEFFFGSQFALVSNIGSSYGVGVVVDIGRLTGLGTEFAESVDKNRDRWVTDVAIQFRYSFGTPPGKTKWGTGDKWTTSGGDESNSDEEESAAHVSPTEERKSPAESSKKSDSDRKVRERVRPITDSDGDGVADKIDKCPATTNGVVVDRSGCPLDTDHDGVPDGLDDCPSTDRMAGVDVDLFGCEVDSDFDGVADYRDACPHNAIGAEVDETGCPIDADGDGVANGLDDCPLTLPGIAVDKYGCTDVSILAKPLVLHINYASGGFEIDPNNKKRLESLARLLLIVPDIKLEVNGYTDDIGTTVANQQLSEKRASRVREFLVNHGIAGARIKVFGRGESDFLASNETSEGRTKNRRIEIVFFK
jgi:outer membrane protein OmpA-like peptidoglycan-associated protein